jgi:octaprenyl-diphosphate synthase
MEHIRQLILPDLQQVDTLISESLRTNVDLIQKICSHIIHSGGKRLRPMLALLSAKLCGYEGNAHIQLAVIIEFIHTATLLHDDVVDASSLRRGQPAANAIWGNQAAVLVGDFLYSRTFELLTQLQSLPLMRTLATATNTIAEGEILQLVNRNNPDISEQHYLDVIKYKTAVLFSAATELGAAIGQRNSAEQQALAQYGLHLGMAFQIVDDWLDYASSAEEMGKNQGDDLADGKITLPLIYAMKHASPAEALLIRKTIEQPKAQNFPAILAIIHATNAFDYVHHCAQQHADLAKTALSNFPSSIYRQALLDLAQLAVDRTN